MNLESKIEAVLFFKGEPLSRKRLSEILSSSAKASEGQGKISEAARYPDIAEEARWEGGVGLSLHVLSDGQLEEALLLKSSGFNLLDEAALALVRSQAPFPAFPPQIQDKDLCSIDHPFVKYQCLRIIAFS